MFESGRHRLDPRDRHARLAHGTVGREVDDGRSGAEREIAVAARHLHERGARTRWRPRKSNLCQQLTLLHGGGESAPEQVTGRDLTRPSVTLDLGHSVEQHREQRPFGGRVGVDDTSDDGAPVPNGDVTDQRHRLADRLAADTDLGIELDVAMPAQRADDQDVALDPVIGELGNAVEVHDGRRPGQPHAEHRHQALATRQRSPLLAEIGHEPKRLVKGPRRVVLERGRLHRVIPAAGSFVTGGVRSARRSLAASTGEAPKAQMTPARAGLNALGQCLVIRS